MGEGFRNQFAQVFVTLAIFAQKDQMVRIIVNAVHPVFHPAASYIDLATDDGLDSGGLGGFIEVNTAVHYTMVCDGDGILAKFLHPIHHAVDPASTVQEAVFCMDM